MRILGSALRLASAASPDSMKQELMRWRIRLFSLMVRNASSLPALFSIPPNRVVKLGARVEF